MNLIEYITANPGQSQADVLTAAQPVVTAQPYFASHRTMLGVCSAVDPVNGPAAAEWFAAALASQMPATYAVYVAAGPTDGSAGGLDVSDPGTQVFLSQMVAAAAKANAPYTDAMRLAAIKLGEVVAYPFDVLLTANDVAAAFAAVALTAARNARLLKLEQWASYVRVAVDAATSVDDLPAVPEVPSA